MKLSIKINLLFTLIVIGILLVITILIYNISRQNIKNEFEQRLENRAARTAYLYKVFQNDTTNLLKSLDANAPPQLFNKTILIYNLRHEILYEFHDSDSIVYRADTSLLRTIHRGGTRFISNNEQEVCLFRNAAGGDPFVVVVAAENITGKAYIDDLKELRHATQHLGRGKADNIMSCLEPLKFLFKSIKIRALLRSAT